MVSKRVAHETSYLRGLELHGIYVTTRAECRQSVYICLSCGVRRYAILLVHAASDLRTNPTAFIQILRFLKSEHVSQGV